MRGGSLKLIYLILLFYSISSAQAHPRPPLEGEPLRLDEFELIRQEVEAFTSLLPSPELQKLQQIFVHPMRERGFCYVLAHCKDSPNGIKVGELPGPLKFKFHQLLTRLLSSQGYLKVLGIMRRELLLEEMEEAVRRYPEVKAIGKNQSHAWDPPLKRNYSDYTLRFFGKLAPGSQFGLRLEGHHLSFNLTLDYRGKTPLLSVTPVFLGVSPMVVPSPPKQGDFPIWRTSEGHHLLGSEAFLARELVKSLPNKNQAIWPEWPAPELAGSLDQRPEASLHGVKLDRPKSREWLIQLLDEYLSVYRVAKPEFFKRDLLKNARISYKGNAQQAMGRFYLRVSSDRYLFELYQSDLWSVESEYEANHIHSSLRDLKADWDQNLLSEHLKNFHTSEVQKNWEHKAAKADKKGSIIQVHGSLGVGENDRLWAKLFQEQGYDVYMIDSFTPRSYTNRKEVGFAAASSHQVQDIMAAIQFLHEKGEGSIVLVGFSLGGYSIMHAYSQHKVLFEAKNPVAKTILFYPRCQDFIGTQLVKNTLFLMGGEDQRAKAADCQRVIDMSPYRDHMALKTYQGAYHGFDDPAFKTKKTVLADDGSPFQVQYHKEAFQKAKEDLFRYLSQSTKTSL